MPDVWDEAERQLGPPDDAGELPEPDHWDTAASGLVEDGLRRDRQLQTFFDLSHGKDNRAAVIDISKRTGVDPKLVENNFEQFKRAAEAASFDARTFQAQNPSLYGLITDAPNTAPLVFKEEGLLRRAVKGMSRSMEDAEAMNPLAPSPWSGVTSWLDPVSPAMELFGETVGEKLERRRKMIAEELPGPRTAEELFRPETHAYQASPLAETTGLARARILSDYWSWNRAQADISHQWTMAIFYDSQAAGEDATETSKSRAHENHKKIVQMQQELGAKPWYGQSGVEQLALDIIEGTASQVESLKGMGGGALVGGGVGAGVGAVVGKAGGARAGLSLGLRIGIPAGTSVTTFDQEAGGAYQEFSQARTDAGDPVDPAIARGAAVLYGVAASTVEVAQLAWFARSFGPLGEMIRKGQGRAAMRAMMGDATKREIFKRVAKAYIEGVASEGVEEGVQNVLQVLTGWGARTATAGELQSLDVEELKVSTAESVYKGAVGAAAGLGLVGAGVHMATYGLKQKASRKAGEQVAAMAELPQSETARAAPEEVARIVREETEASGRPVRELWVDPVRLTALFKEEEDTSQAMRELLGDDYKERMQEATGNYLDEDGQRATLRVGLEEYLEKWGSRELARLLASDTTTQSGYMTAREQAERDTADAETRTARAQELVEEYRRTGEWSPGSEAESAFVEQIETNLEQTGQYTPGQVAEIVAVERAHAEVMARRSDQSVDDVMEMYTVTLAKAGEQAAVLEAPTTPAGEATVDVLGRGFEALEPAEQAVRYFRDRNTGALNMRGFEALPRDSSRPFLAVFDAEGFKFLNDRFGHTAGDGLLRTMAGALGQAGIGDYAKRGGSLIAWVSDPAQAQALGASMQEAVGQQLIITASAAEGTGKLDADLDAAFENQREVKDLAVGQQLLGHRRGAPVGAMPPSAPPIAFEAGFEGVALESEQAQLALAGAETVLEPLATGLKEAPIPEGVPITEALEEAFAALRPGEAFETIHREESGLLTEEGFVRAAEKKWKASLDMRLVRELNEAFGEEDTDGLMALFSATLAKEGGGDIDAAHFHGDEFAAQHDDRATLKLRLEAARRLAHRFVITKQIGPDSYLLQDGVHFAYGIANTFEKADRDELARAKKRQRDVPRPEVLSGDDLVRRLHGLEGRSRIFLRSSRLGQAGVQGGIVEAAGRARVVRDLVAESQRLQREAISLRKTIETQPDSPLVEHAANLLAMVDHAKVTGKLPKRVTRSTKVAPSLVAGVDQVLDESGVRDDHASEKEDGAYRTYLQGRRRGAKPAPFADDTFDPVNHALDLEGADKVSGALEAVDLLTRTAVQQGIAKQPHAWAAIEEGLKVLRQVAGYERLRLPEHVQEAQRDALAEAEEDYFRALEQGAAPTKTGEFVYDQEIGGFVDPTEGDVLEQQPQPRAFDPTTLRSRPGEPGPGETTVPEFREGARVWSAPDLVKRMPDQSVATIPVGLGWTDKKGAKRYSTFGFVVVRDKMWGDLGFDFRIEERVGSEPLPVWFDSEVIGKALVAGQDKGEASASLHRVVPDDLDVRVRFDFETVTAANLRIDEEERTERRRRRVEYTLGRPKAAQKAEARGLDAQRLFAANRGLEFQGPEVQAALEEAGLWPEVRDNENMGELVKREIRDARQAGREVSEITDELHRLRPQREGAWVLFINGVPIQHVVPRALEPDEDGRTYIGKIPGEWYLEQLADTATKAELEAFAENEPRAPEDSVHVAQLWAFNKLREAGVKGVRRRMMNPQDRGIHWLRGEHEVEWSFEEHRPEEGQELDPEDRGGDPVYEDEQAFLEQPPREEEKGKKARGWISMTKDGLKRAFAIFVRDHADVSTPLHELSHAWLEMMGDIAEQVDAPTQMVDDWKRAMNYLGVASRAELDDAGRERWADAFETYLLEGKAPSRSLVETFQHLRSWLIRIYKTLSALPDTVLDDNIRGVFDRLLATDEEIAEMQTSMGVAAPMFASADEAGATPQQFQDYQDRWDRQSAVAAAAVHREVAEAQNRVMSAEWRAEVKRNEPKAQLEWNERRDSRVWRYLRKGEVTNEQGEVDEDLSGPELGKLDRDEVRRTARPSSVRIEKRLRGRLARPGEDPADVAVRYGFETAQEMLGAVVALPVQREWVRARAEQITREEHPELALERERVQELAARALHDEGTSDALLREGQMLMGLGKLPGLPPVQAMKDSAKLMAEQQTVRRIPLGNLLTKERQHAEKAVAAFARGDFGTAAFHKQRQLTAHFMYRELSIAKEDREKFEKLADQFLGRTRRSVLAKAGRPFVDGADAILEAIKVKQPETDETILAERISLTEVMVALERQEIALGFDLAVLQRIMERPPPGGWRDLKVSELRVVRDALSQLYAAARERHTMVVEGQRVEIQDLSDDIRTEASVRPDLGPDDWNDRPTRLQGLVAFATDPRVMLKKLGATAHNVLWRGYLQAREREDDLSREVTQQLVDMWDKLPREMRKRRDEQLEDLEGVEIDPGHSRQGPRTRRWMWMVALNMGNASNMERLTGGYNWDEAAVRGWLERNMTEEERHFVQGIWDLFDKKLYPELARVFKDVNGITPEKIEAVPFVTKYGVFEGGYFPARYDPMVSRIGEAQSQAAEEAQYKQRAGQHTIAKSFTKQRAAQYRDIVNLNWDVVPSHVISTIHYAAFERFVRDSRRVLNNGSTRDAVRRYLGKPYGAQLDAWLDTAATFSADSVPAALADAHWAIRWPRTAFSVSILGYSLPVALGDLTNPLVAWAKGDVSTRAMASTAAQTIIPWRFARTRKAALLKSPELRNRQEKMGVLLRRHLTHMGGTSTGPSKIVEGAIRAAFWLFEATDYLTSTVVWDAAYRTELSRAREQGFDTPAQIEQRAVKLADDAVQSSLPSYNPAEQPAILRDKRAMSALIVFFSYFSKLGNVTQEVFEPAVVAWGDEAQGPAEATWETAKATGRFLAVMAVTSVLAELASGRGREEDEEVPEYLTRKMMSAPFLMIPIVGFLGESIAGTVTSNLWHGEDRSRRWSVRGSPLASAVEKLGLAISKARDEGRDTDERVMAALEMLGMLTFAPFGTSQFRRTAGYAAADEGLVEDIEQGDLAGVASGLIYGKREGQPANIFTPFTHD